jgi:hypothetical protein
MRIGPSQNVKTTQQWLSTLYVPSEESSFVVGSAKECEL